MRTRTLRLVTYNILLGGARREQHITNVLRRLKADVVALQEVSNPTFARALADDLRMELVVGESSDGKGVNTAVMSRLPMRRWSNRVHRGRMLRGHLEVDIDTGGEQLPRVRLHCVHLAARFGERSKGEVRRGQELSAILGDIGERSDVPHALIGDFNSLAPGDHLGASTFFRRINELRRAQAVVRRHTGLVGPRQVDDDDPVGQEGAAAFLRAGVDPRLDVGIPVLPFVVYPLTQLAPRSRSIDRLLGAMVPRWTVERLLSRGYVDSFRSLHPRADGFTCATWCPAARIDYVFADERMAPSLQRCEVVGTRRWPDRETLIASDHHPVVAEFSI